jgi:hypothetical protein
VCARFRGCVTRFEWRGEKANCTGLTRSWCSFREAARDSRDKSGQVRIF